jgi:hypothetical protein
VPVPGSKTEVLCICILRASIVPVSVAFCIGFGAVPMGVVFFVFTIKQHYVLDGF